MILNEYAYIVFLVSKENGYNGKRKQILLLKKNMVSTGRLRLLVFFFDLTAF